MKYEDLDPLIARQSAFSDWRDAFVEAIRPVVVGKVAGITVVSTPVVPSDTLFLTQGNRIVGVITNANKMVR